MHGLAAQSRTCGELGGGGGEGGDEGGVGDGNEGAGGGGLGGGIGGGKGGGGEGGEGNPQQASLQLAESFFFFLLHKFVHFFWVSPLHAFCIFLLSFFLHVFLSLSASQFFGDGVGAVPLLLPISGADSIFRMSMTGVVDGATAPTYSSTQKVASHLIKRGRITCGADHMR